MDFQKIKFTPGEGTKRPQVELKYEQETEEGGTETHRLKCDEVPTPSFLEALQAFAPVLRNACMLPETDADDEPTEARIRIRSVTIKRKAGTRAVVVTGLRDLDWISSPLVINTPLAGELLIPAEDVPELIDTLEAEAAAYVRGDRAEPDLFEGDGASNPLQEFANEYDTEVRIRGGRFGGESTTIKPEGR